MKATKESFDKAIELYNEYGRLCGMGENTESDAKRVCDEYNALIEKYDFDNEVFSDEAGRLGVKTCYGEVLVPAKYDRMNCFNQNGISDTGNLAIATRDGVCYLIDRQGREVFSADTIVPESPAFEAVLFSTGGKWGIANSKGQVVLPALYDAIKPDSNGFTFLEQDGKNGFIANGHVVEPKFDSIDIDTEDYITVTLDGRHGYIDCDDSFTDDIENAYYHFDMFL